MPSTATSPSPTKTRVAEQVRRIRQATQETQHRQRIADELLLEAARQGRELDAEELVFLGSLGWDVRRIQQELGRACAVVTEMKGAGTAADYAAAKKELTNAEAARAGQVPELERQIAELRAQVAKLDRDAQVPRETLRRFDLSRDRLRTRLVPEFVLKHEEVAKRDFHLQYGRRIHETRQRVKELDAIIALEREVNKNHDRIVLHLNSLPASHSARPHADQTFDRAAFSAYLQERRKERASLIAELRKLEADAQPALDAVERVRDFYIDQL